MPKNTGSTGSPPNNNNSSSRNRNQAFCSNWLLASQWRQEARQTQQWWLHVTEQTATHPAFSVAGKIVCARGCDASRRASQWQWLQRHTHSAPPKQKTATAREEEDETNAPGSSNCRSPRRTRPDRLFNESEQEAWVLQHTAKQIVEPTIDVRDGGKAGRHLGDTRCNHAADGGAAGESGLRSQRVTLYRDRRDTEWDGRRSGDAKLLMHKKTGEAR